MPNLMKPIKRHLWMFLLLGSFFSAAYAIDGDETLSVLEGIRGDENFSTLLSLLEQSGLTEDLQGEGPVTVFAPSNGVFEDLMAGGVDLSSDPEALRQALSQHVIQGAYTVLELRNSNDGGSFTTLQGGALEVDLGAGGLTVNGVGLDSTDVDNVFANGVVHVVDGVIGVDAAPPLGDTDETTDETTDAADTSDQTNGEMGAADTEDDTDTAETDTTEAETTETETSEPDTSESETADAENADDSMADADSMADVVTVLQNDGRFGTLLSALEQAGLNGLFDEGGPFTLFAPTDEAFAALPEAERSALLNDSEALTRVLSYHVVEGETLSSDLEDGETLTSLSGDELNVNLADGVTVNESPVLEADIAADNAVIHVVDSVLLPEGLELAALGTDDSQTDDSQAASEETTEAGTEESTEQTEATEQTGEESTEEAAEETSEETAEATAEQEAQTTEAEAQEAANQDTDLGQSADLAQQEQNAMVRFVHLSPNAPNVDISFVSTLEGEADTTTEEESTETEASESEASTETATTGTPEGLTDLAYEDSTDYAEVLPGEYTLSVSAEGATVLEQTLSFAPGVHYTLAAIGLVLPAEDAEADAEEGGFFSFMQNLFGGNDERRDRLALQLLVLEDNLSFPADEGEALLRLVHASPGTDAVDLTVADPDGEGRDVLLDDVEFGSVSSYAPIFPPLGEPALRVSDSEAVALELSDLSPEGNTVTTVFLVGTSLERAPLGILQLSDATEAMMPVDPAGTAVAGTLTDILLGSPDLSTLSDALSRTGMLEILSGPGPFTLFAPTDEAFAALPQADLDALLADPEALTRVLENHVVQGALPSAEVGEAGMLTSLDGVNLEVATAEDGSVTINEAAVTNPDLQASNGVIHLINTVLIPDDLEVQAADGTEETENTEDSQDGENSEGEGN